MRWVLLLGRIAMQIACQPVDERARAESGRGVEPGEPRPDDGDDCGERFGIEPQAGSQASEDVSDRRSGRDLAQGTRSGFEQSDRPDGSDHHWFEDRGPSCTLLVFIDDTTSTLMHLEFVTPESTLSYFGALEAYLHEHGRPVAFYSDKHSVFRVSNEAAKSGHGMTLFGCALNEWNIEILSAWQASPTWPRPMRSPSGL